MLKVALSAELLQVSDVGHDEYLIGCRHAGKVVPAVPLKHSS